MNKKRPQRPKTTSRRKPSQARPDAVPEINVLINPPKKPSPFREEAPKVIVATATEVLLAQLVELYGQPTARIIMSTISGVAKFATFYLADLSHAISTVLQWGPRPDLDPRYQTILGQIPTDR